MSSEVMYFTPNIWRLGIIFISEQKYFVICYLLLYDNIRYYLPNICSCWVLDYFSQSCSSCSNNWDITTKFLHKWCILLPIFDDSGLFLYQWTKVLSNMLTWKSAACVIILSMYLYQVLKSKCFLASNQMHPHDM